MYYQVKYKHRRHHVVEEPEVHGNVLLVHQEVRVGLKPDGLTAIKESPGAARSSRAKSSRLDRRSSLQDNNGQPMSSCPLSETNGRLPDDRE